MITVEYWKDMKMWHAYYSDEQGKLVTGFSTKKREDAIFGLGMWMGRNAERHSRPLSEYLDKPAKVFRP